MIFVDIISIIGIITMALANESAEIYLTGHFICGVCGGINWPLVILYIKEMSPHAII